MKKSLLAVAAIGAFASAAQAQSSVTVYGILDVGFVGTHYNGTAAGPNTATTGNTNAAVPGGAPNVNASSAGFGQSAESTSRLGFKGKEDLGGGLNAIFTVETAIDPDGKANAFQFNRQTFAGLSKNGLGSTTIGTQYTPIFDVMATTDAAGMNNLAGNAVYATNVQSSTGTYNTGLGGFASTTATASTGGPISINANSGAYVTRVSNALKVQSERIGGLQGQAFYAQSNNSQSGTTGGISGANNNTMFGFNADYVWNKLNVVAAYQSFRAQQGTLANAAGSSNTSGLILANGTAGLFGNNASDAQTYAAATYDFGIVKTYAQYITRKVFSTADSNFQTQRAAYQLGAKSFITPTISVYATYGLGKSSYAQAGTAYANFRTMQVGTDYYLSKRTNLYVAYGSFNQSSPNSAAVPTISSLSGMNYATGIRHTF
ncbi:porin [Polynucleobacter sp. AP-Elch-400A-B2]|uniref:porin n=1 Tax=Polynucleobacter sp. AP-Elch-400A-B2 TaxID=2576930 RepID=UPI001BFEE508|nr:porin [Polynucleobacter sp. AP-Elch-400A-B2]QWE24803.1 porin [Polynucleobacter sp. AP-Elch-400A-B2]